ncbi:anti-sigma factor [Microbacteriaceae bacterium 4G12]
MTDVADASEATPVAGIEPRATTVGGESRPFSASIPIVPPADRTPLSEPTPIPGRTPAADSSAGAAASGPAEARARARWYARPGLVLGSAAAALALFAGGVAVGVLFEEDSPQVEAEASALAELYAAPDAQRRSADVEGDGTATLVWSEQLDRSVVVFDELAPLPEDSVYEAWYINSAGTATPAGTFRTETDGLVYHLLDGSLGRGGTVGVTVEPDPGSEAPTTKPIVLLNRA